MTSNYYQKHKEKLPKEAPQNLSEEEKGKMSRKTWKRYQNLTEEEKEKTLHYHRECNKNLSEEQKKKVGQYRRNYYIYHIKNNSLAAL